MIALLYLDVETTGLDSRLNDVIQLACIPVINGVEQKHFNEFCQPLNYETVEQGAIDAHGITVQKMKTFQPQSEMIKSFVAYLKQFNCNFVMAGFNINFDRKFLGALFQKHGFNEEYREFFSNNVHDVYTRAKLLKSQKKIASAKLGVVAEYLGVTLDNAHDALNDIRATIEVDEKLSDLLGEHQMETNSSIVLPDFDVPEPPALHLHSEYSVYDSATTSAQWLKWAQKNKVSGVAFPDHVYATSLFTSVNPPMNKDTKQPLYPDVTMVPAISIWVRDNGLEYTLNAWATSNTGYRNLMKLSSLGWVNPISLDGDKKFAPCVDLETLSSHGEDVVFGSACDKGLLSAILDSTMDFDSAVKYVRHLSTQFSLVFELLTLDINKYYSQVYGMTAYSKPTLSPYQNRAKAINNLARSLSKSSTIKCIISSAAHFIDESEKIVQDCKMKNSFKDERYFWESRHQRSAKEQYAILASHIEGFSLGIWNALCSNAQEIVDAAKSIKIKHDYLLPAIEIPDDIKSKTDDYDKQLYYLTMKKIVEHGRWNDDPTYVARFKKELDVIWKNDTMNFLAYFLLYEDIGTYARSQGILQGLARGSAGGCLLSYYLKITHLDPVKNDLPFERFLSHARIKAGSFPDVDSDFGNRTPIIAYLKEKYGLGFAQIGTFLKMKVKSAIKQAMFALYGRPSNDFEIARLCDLIPDSPQGLDEFKFVYGYVDSEDVAHKGAVETTPELANFFNQYPDCEELVKKLLGLPASLGRHASAFVISTVDLSDGRVPTFLVEDHDLGAVPVVQLDGAMTEKSGLVKADILGVTTIQTISDCLRRIRDRHSVDLLEEDEKGVASIYRLPEDSAVYTDFYNRKTDSSFQFNTDLIKGFVRDFAPQSVKDLADLTALARPGALDVEAAPGISATKQYVLVRNNQADPIYVHPELQPILKETYGVVAYQEQLMKILVDIAGYTLEESDQIRSAIAKKKRDVMTKAFERVREATAKRGWTQEQAQGLCDVLTAYSNYSFNRSHSFAYASLGYITMYLKHHYPLEWWASELNLSNEDKLRKYMGVIGHLIQPPNLKVPSTEWEIVDDKISAPLTSVKGIGEKPVRQLMVNGPYESFEELLHTNEGKTFHIGSFSACLKARATDCFLDPSLPYKEAKKKLVSAFFAARGKDIRLVDNAYKRHDIKKKQVKQKAFDPIFEESDPFKLYMMEREVSKVFSKSLLSDAMICKWLESNLTALKPTGKPPLPYVMGEDQTPIIRDVDVMSRLLEKNPDMDNSFYGVFLFQGSSGKSGTSKKSGRPWKKLEVELSDGVRTIYCTIWDRDKPLRWNVDAPVIVHGRLALDWRSRPTLVIDSIEKIEDLIFRRKNDEVRDI